MPRGAHASSVHYSLIETAKLHSLEPYQYLNTVFKALPYADTVEKPEKLYLEILKKNRLLHNYATSLSAYQIEIKKNTGL